MLNECQTPMGKRTFMYNILNPVCDEEYLQREYDITEHYLTKYDDYHSFLKNTLSTIKDISKWERQIFLKKISPKAFYNLYNNISTIKNIYGKIREDTQIMNYLHVFEKNILNIETFCDNITEFIATNLSLDLASDLDQTQNFETNFIQHGIDQELDKKTEILKECELKLAAIQVYLSSIVENKEKKNSKTHDFVKIHETEKNNFSLLCTSRRCKLLQEALPKDPSIVNLSYHDSSKSKNFDFKISKTQFSFEKQSSTNN
jgi:DNA mismatch repair protein MutS